MVETNTQNKKDNDPIINHIIKKSFFKSKSR